MSVQTYPLDTFGLVVRPVQTYPRIRLDCSPVWLVQCLLWLSSCFEDLILNVREKKVQLAISVNCHFQCRRIDKNTLNIATITNDNVTMKRNLSVILATVCHSSLFLSNTESLSFSTLIFRI